MEYQEVLNCSPAQGALFSLLTVKYVIFLYICPIVSNPILFLNTSETIYGSDDNNNTGNGINSSTGGQRRTVGSIVGVVIGSVAGLVIIIGSLFLFSRYRRAKTNGQSDVGGTIAQSWVFENPSRFEDFFVKSDLCFKHIPFLQCIRPGWLTAT